MNMNPSLSLARVRAKAAVACLLFATGGCGCDGHRLTYACKHDPDFDCSPYPAARARLARPPAVGEDPYDAEAGTCGSLSYLRYFVDTLPGDQQENKLITQYYDVTGTLVAARVANNYDSSGTFASHIDYGAVPTCAPAKRATVNPAKERFRAP